MNKTTSKGSLLSPSVVCATAVELVGAAVVRMLRYRAAWYDATREIERLRGKMIDWPELHFYEEANAAMVQSTRPRVVFIGDSITQRWDLPKYFPEFEVANRGIGWQTTSEMLVRFRQDVIELMPTVVVILGGSNDFHVVSGPSHLAAVQNNIQSMIDLANQQGILPLIGTIPPVAIDALRDREVEEFAFDSVSSYNDWLRVHFCGTRCLVVDFDLALRQSNYALSDLLPDGCHPNQLGYALMADATKPALMEVLSRTS